MHPDLRLVLDRAEIQHGVASRDQALSSGLSEHILNQALADGLLVPVCRGVYRVAGTPQSEPMAVQAAALRYGGRISHVTAARLLRLNVPLRPVPLHVTVDVRTANPRGGRVQVRDDGLRQQFFPVRVHRSEHTTDPTTTVDGVVCSDAARTLIEVAPLLAPIELESAFERARRLGLVSFESLGRRFGELGGSGRPGTRRVRDLLSRAAPGVLDSELEVLAWAMLRTAPFSLPVRQHRVDIGPGRSCRLDFAWPELLLAFETEGFEWHGTHAQWKQDRRRTAALERLGWRILVATWEDVNGAPADTLQRVAGALAERHALRAISHLGPRHLPALVH